MNNRWVFFSYRVTAVCPGEGYATWHAGGWVGVFCYSKFLILVSLAFVVCYAVAIPSSAPFPSWMIRLCLSLCWNNETKRNETKNKQIGSCHGWSSGDDYQGRPVTFLPWSRVSHVVRVGSSKQECFQGLLVQKQQVGVCMDCRDRAAVLYKYKPGGSHQISGYFSIFPGGLARLNP